MNEDRKLAARPHRRLVTMIVVLVIGTVLSWAVATTFELAFINAIALVVLAVFAIVVALLMLGIS